MIDCHHGPPSHSHKMTRPRVLMLGSEIELLDEDSIVTKPLDPTAQSISDPDAALVGKESAWRSPLGTIVAPCRQARLDPPIDMKALHGSLPRPVSHSHVYAIAMRRYSVRLIQHTRFITTTIATRRHWQA